MLSKIGVETSNQQKKITIEAVWVIGTEMKSSLQANSRGYPVFTVYLLGKPQKLSHRQRLSGSAGWQCNKTRGLLFLKAIKYLVINSDTFWTKLTVWISLVRGPAPTVSTNHCTCWVYIHYTGRTLNPNCRNFKPTEKNNYWVCIGHRYWNEKLSVS